MSVVFQETKSKQIIFTADEKIMTVINPIIANLKGKKTVSNTESVFVKEHVSFIQDRLHVLCGVDKNNMTYITKTSKKRKVLKQLDTEPNLQETEPREPTKTEPTETIEIMYDLSNPFFMYCFNERPKIKEKFKLLSPFEITDVLRSEWRKLQLN